MKTRAALGVPRDYAPWTSQQKPGVPAHPRVRDVIDVAFIRSRTAFPTQTVADAVKGLVVNITQCVSKVQAFHISKLGAFSASTILYSYEHDGIYAPSGLLRLLGWPADDTVAGTAHDCQELVGVGQSVPSIALLTAALVLNPFGEWWGVPRSRCRSR